MEKYKYKVTIGMPVYGVEPYIRKSMLSVLSICAAKLKKITDVTKQTTIILIFFIKRLDIS